MRVRNLIDTIRPNKAHPQLDTRSPDSRPASAAIQNSGLLFSGRKRRGLHWMMLLLPSIVVAVTLIAG